MVGISSANTANYVVTDGNYTVNVDTGAVAIGDQLVTSTTSGRATVDNKATTGIVGYATSAKAGGSNGTVTLFVRPVRGQYTPTFRSSAASSTAFQVQNASGNQVLTVDTSANQIVLGKSATLSGSIAFQDSVAGGHTVTISAQAVDPSANVSILLPVTGASGTQCLTSTGGSTTTNTTLIFGSCAGGSTLATTYSNGTGPSDSTITLDTTRKGVIIQDAVAPIASNLFTVQANGANSTPYLNVTASNLAINVNTDNTGYLNTPSGGFGQYSNLLKQSSAFDQVAGAPWTVTSVTNPTANTVVAPDGNTTAESLADSGSGGKEAQAFTTSTIGNYTFSVWLKAAANQNVDLRIDSTGTNAQTGTVKTVVATTAWQRFFVTQNITGPAISTIVVNIFPGQTGGSGTVSAWGAQLVTGTSPQVYIATTATAVTTATTGLNVSGNSTFTPVADSTTAFQIQNATGGSLFSVDSTNSNITLNGLDSGALGAWSTNGANQIPGNITSQSSVTANGYVYAIGGNNAGTPVATVYYAKLNNDGSTGAWSTNTANPLPAARYGGSAVTANGFVYYFGGYNSGGQTTVYYAKLNSDGSVGAWTTSSNPLTTASYFHSSVVLNGYVYIIGGGVGGTTNVYYAKLNADGSTGIWNQAANGLPLARYSQSSVVANGYIYAIGGNNAGGTTTVYYVKPNTDGSISSSWTSNANPLRTGLDFPTSVVSNGYVYVIGGGNTDPPSTVYQTIYYAKINANTGDRILGVRIPPICQLSATATHLSLLMAMCMLSAALLPAVTPTILSTMPPPPEFRLAATEDLVGLQEPGLS